MLVESDYDSWKIRIHRYIRGKPNGKLIWKSIQNGPTPHPMITNPPPTDSTVVPALRKKLDFEFNEEENKLEMADTQAEIILSQGLPRHIFNILNQTRTQRRFGINGRCLCKDHVVLFNKEGRSCLMSTNAFVLIGKRIFLHDYFAFSQACELHERLLSSTFQPSDNTKFVNNLQPIGLISNDRFDGHKYSDSNLLSGFKKQLTTHQQPAPDFLQHKVLEQEDSQILKDKALLMEAKEERRCLDAEAEAFHADVECTALMINLRHYYNKHVTSQSIDECI
ncbi:hypothetical protein Tco_0907109 [Tanacetum coccineum]|uniref:Uncharacterized protein n=1 Tax=Tanacetum coccineum TaxID=301880 RepID=A0ABQ5CPN7_9ASTR